MIDTKHWTDALIAMNACNEAVTWCKTQPDLATAWRDCRRADWMLWLIGRTEPTKSSNPGDAERRKLVGVAAECARLVLPIFEKRRPNDSRVRDCLDLCDRFAAGDEGVTLRQLRAATAYADAAAYADAYADADAAAAATAAATAAAAAYAAADAAAYADAYAYADAAAAAAATAAATATAAAYAAAAAAAYADADAAAYAYAARSKMRAQCADVVRKWYPTPPVIAEVPR